MLESKAMIKGEASKAVDTTKVVVEFATQSKVLLIDFQANCKEDLG